MKRPPTNHNERITVHFFIQAALVACNQGRMHVVGIDDSGTNLDPATPHSGAIANSTGKTGLNNRSS